MLWPCASNLGSRLLPSTNPSETSPSDVRINNVSNSKPGHVTVLPTPHLCVRDFDPLTHLVMLDPVSKRYTHPTPVKAAYIPTTLLSTAIFKTTPNLSISPMMVTKTSLSCTTHRIRHTFLAYNAALMSSGHGKIAPTFHGTPYAFSFEKMPTTWSRTASLSQTSPVLTVPLLLTNNSKAA